MATFVGTVLDMTARMPRSRIKSDFLKIRATTDQLERWRRASELARLDNDELDYSSWVRTTLNEAAKALEERHGTKAAKGGGR